MTVTFLNLGFEEGDNSSSTSPSGGLFLPSQWALTGLSSAGSELANFDFGDLLITVDEFEHWTVTTGFLALFDSPDIDTATFNTGLHVSTVEHFEAEWSGNEDFIFSGLPLRQLATFDTGTPEGIEDFEEEWGGNENDIFAFTDPDLSSASFDTGTPEGIEDFEEEWGGNENYKLAFVGTGTDLTAAIWDDGSSGDTVEDFEEVDDTSHVVNISIAQAGDYTIEINGRAHVHTATGGDTFTQIRDALVSILNSSPVDVLAIPAVSSNVLNIKATRLTPGDEYPFYAVGASGPDAGDMVVVETDRNDFWTQSGVLIT